MAPVCRAVALLSSVCPSLAWLAATVSRRETQLSWKNVGFRKHLFCMTKVDVGVFVSLLQSYIDPDHLHLGYLLKDNWWY